jgi:hypothetical protein
LTAGPAVTRRRWLALALGAAVAASARAAAAQEGWLDRARDLWGQYGGWVTGGARQLTVGEIAQGLREALRVGTGTVVAQLGRLDGFYGDPAVRIPLPAALEPVQRALSTVGFAGLLDDLELRLNRAAETATPRAKEVFWEAIARMTIDDAMRIYEGPEDAATQYFRGAMTDPLKLAFRPIVDTSLADAGAVRAFDDMLARYQTIPLVPALGANMKGRLIDHALDKSLDGLFHYLAQEEAAIRRDPAKRTTEILQRVFGR